MQLNGVGRLTDISLLEAMLILVEDPECAGGACEIIAQIMDDAVRRGRTDEFRTGALPFVNLLMDIEVGGGDDASARAARAILELVNQ